MRNNFAIHTKSAGGAIALRAVAGAPRTFFSPREKEKNLACQTLSVTFISPSFELLAQRGELFLPALVDPT